MSKKLKVLELFAGTRSIGKAFEKRDHEVFSIEWDKKHNNIDWYVDISTITAQDIIERFGHPDVIWASPDCTTYSIAGISHHRERVFVLSILGEHDLYEFHGGFELNVRLKDILESTVDEKYYLSKEVQDRFKPNKANQVIEKLIETNQINDDLITCDLSINDPKVKDVSNCIKARYDCGVSNQRSDGTGVVERIEHDSNKLQILGGIGDKKWGENSYPQGYSVYSIDGIACTQTANGGGLGARTGLYKINNSEPLICASRGRNPENPSDRTAGIHLEQRLEINYSGTSNTITTVQKDNYVLEPNVLRPERTEYGKAVRKQYESGEITEKIGNMREYNPRTDGIANTLTTVQKDNYLMECVVQEAKCLAESTRKEPIEVTVKPNKDLRPHRLDAKKSGLSELSINYDENCTNVVTTSHSPKIYGTSTDFRIRKLTPKECWRLMGIDDECFDKAEQVNSNSQLYKQAGNGIVVDVLYYIFKELFKNNIIE